MDPSLRSRRWGNAARVVRTAARKLMFSEVLQVPVPQGIRPLCRSLRVPGACHGPSAAAGWVPAGGSFSGSSRQTLYE